MLQQVPGCQFGYGPLWGGKGCQIFNLESHNSQMSIYIPGSGWNLMYQTQEQSLNNDFPGFALRSFYTDAQNSEHCFNRPFWLYFLTLLSQVLILLLINVPSPAPLPYWLSESEANPGKAHNPPSPSPTSHWSQGPVIPTFSVYPGLLSLLSAKQLFSCGHLSQAGNWAHLPAPDPGLSTRSQHEVSLAPHVSPSPAWPSLSWPQPPGSAELLSRHRWVLILSHLWVFQCTVPVAWNVLACFLFAALSRHTLDVSRPPGSRQGSPCGQSVPSFGFIWVQRSNSRSLYLSLICVSVSSRWTWHPSGWTVFFFPPLP